MSAAVSDSPIRGRWQAPQNFGTRRFPFSVAVGDVNGDGVQDLAVACSDSYPDYLGAVSVLLGNGNGSFQAAQNFGVGRSAQSVAVGDFNGDGRPDLAANYSYGVSVLINNTRH